MVRRRIRARLEFEPRDLWVGLYWEKRNIGELKRYDYYICVVPMLPIHVVYTRWNRISGFRKEEIA